MIVVETKALIRKCCPKMSMVPPVEKCFEERRLLQAIKNWMVGEPGNENELDVVLFTK